ncbi:hypothetical protein [Acinetobacter higginsii]|uniref:hypothetical protein n=1 Tax=Acinetobacter higginsii TaxID=70347 RepID=UPI001F60364A|nr:hypothetical protein [Acinetobacter higginsii]MCI3879562.1 hypothetical protein [Acinetobacter higginsii]
MAITPVINDSKVIADFQNANNLTTDNRGNLQPFQCRIEYTSKGIGNTYIIADVRLTIEGYNFGDVEIIDDPNEPIDPRYHLFFSYNLQNYKFIKKDKSLKISGKSDKMKGTYSVKIKVV